MTCSSLGTHPRHALVLLRGRSREKHTYGSQLIPSDNQSLPADIDSYQRITLPDGSVIQGRDRSSSVEIVFPEDLTGKSVLDVGCGNGAFCLEAARRGAARVVGVDQSAEYLSNARRIAAAWGRQVEFRRGDVGTLSFEERFDYVLCLNVLQFVRDPLCVIEKLAAITCERLVLEVAGFGRSDRRNMGLDRFRAAILARMPVMYLGRPGIARGRRIARNYFSASAIENLLMHRIGGFARVDIEQSGHKGRFIAIAHKRRIGHLIVVAGATGAGKATLIRNLRSGSASDLATQLGITAPETLVSCSANELYQLRAAVVPQLLLHFDLPSLSLDWQPDALSILNDAARVTFVTVRASASDLRARLDAQHAAGRFWRRSAEERRYRRIRRIYEQPEKLDLCYQEWLEVVRSHPGAEHVLISL